ncbi:MAG: hypothetical protein WC249_01900 [Patescibacteria group bacterium]|jgi:hypothetical protein
MEKLSNESIEEEVISNFVSHDTKTFKWKIGKVLASSLSGFIAGIIVTVIFFLTVFDLVFKGNNPGF